VCPLVTTAVKKGIWPSTLTFLTPPPLLSFLLAFSASSLILLVALHPHLFQSSILDEAEVHKLVANYFLQDHAMLPWRPTAEEGIPIPNTNEIVVFSSFFQREYGLSAYDFFPWLLDHYKIELVHLIPNFVLQIIVFVHLSEAFLGIPPNFPLFKNYFS
jgi:hypothetical protein